MYKVLVKENLQPTSIYLDGYFEVFSTFAFIFMVKLKAQGPEFARQRLLQGSLDGFGKREGGHIFFSFLTAFTYKKNLPYCHSYINKVIK